MHFQLHPSAFTSARILNPSIADATMQKKTKTWELSAYLSDAELVALAEAFGGTRLHVPIRAGDDHQIVRVIGRDGFAKLSAVYAPDTIRIPICRELRALHYRTQGLSNAQIASRLCMTETGVNAMFQCVSSNGTAIPAPRAVVKRAPVPTSETSPASTGENDARAPIHLALPANGVNTTSGSKAA